MGSFDVRRTLLEIKDTYINERTIAVDGKDITRILSFLGATEKDIEGLKDVSNHLVPDPTLPFRESRNGRFCLDFAQSRLHRLEYQPFVLSAAEDFVRYDSGQVREFRGITDNVQLNTAFQALLFFKAFVIKDVNIRSRPNLNEQSKKWVSTVFNLRTITTPDLIGEPALEGVHSDGVDHTMTTLVGKGNITENSAITHVHDIREKNGTRWSDVNPDLVVSRSRHSNFLDTLLIVDHERKHSLSPVHAIDPQQRATRDMFIFFTRRPATEQHISFPYDSFNLHRELPLSVEFPEAVTEGVRELVLEAS